MPSPWCKIPLAFARLLRVGGMAFCLAGWLGSASAQSLNVPLPRVPQRIISLVPSLTESVCALDACDRLVGVDRSSNWPPQVQALPKLGGLDDAQLERIVALKPDLVLAAASVRVVPRLQSLGVSVLVLEAQTQIQVMANLRSLGQRLGQVNQAEKLIQQIQQQIQAAAARIPATYKNKRVYFEIASTPYAAGPRSFIGETLTALGLQNVIAPELGIFPQINPEHIVRQQPDLIMAPQQAFDSMTQRPGWQHLVALKTQQICGFSASEYDVLVRPGPRLGEGAGKIADCLAHLDQINKRQNRSHTNQQNKP